VGASIQTPLDARAWATCLVASQYPDLHAATALVRCLRLGVDLGYQGQRTAAATGENLPSALEHGGAIDADMQKQLALGRRLGPFRTPPYAFFKANPLGVVFKKGKTKPRVVHHLSWPRGADSVNASVRDFTVGLGAFDRAVAALQACGKGAFIAKVDIESAYRCIPVRPEDWPLQGMRWRDVFYMDIVMQFGLASATAIFEWYSSAVEYMVRSLLGIVHVEHYIDDFVVIHPQQGGCNDAVQRMLALFAKLGLPVAPDKIDGPAQLMVFLGVLFDTINMTLSLDADRLHAIEAMLADWAQRKSASREELQSLIGTLGFASKVVRASRIFLRRMIGQLKTIPMHAAASRQYHLSDRFQRDVRWWRTFVRAWNGKSVLPVTQWQADVAGCVELYTDACTAGYGAVHGSAWFAGTWTEAEELAARREERDSMPWKELHVVARAVATWGPTWQGMHVRLQTDCQPVVNAWRSGDSPSEAQAELLRTLLYLSAVNDFVLSVVHIAGVDNVCADLLSRGQIEAFRALPKRHDPLPITPLPLPIHDW